MWSTGGIDFGFSGIEDNYYKALIIYLAKAKSDANGNCVCHLRIQSKIFEPNDLKEQLKKHLNLDLPSLTYTPNAQIDNEKTQETKPRVGSYKTRLDGEKLIYSFSSEDMGKILSKIKEVDDKKRGSISR